MEKINVFCLTLKKKSAIQQFFTFKIVLKTIYCHVLWLVRHNYIPTIDFTTKNQLFCSTWVMWILNDIFQFWKLLPFYLRLAKICRTNHFFLFLIVYSQIWSKIQNPAMNWCKIDFMSSANIVTLGWIPKKSSTVNSCLAPSYFLIETSKKLVW